MKKYYLTTLIICLLVLLASSFVYHFWDEKQVRDVIVVGFLSENDELTLSTNNFMQTRLVLEREFQGRIELKSLTNVQSDQTKEGLEELVQGGCDLIFTITRSDVVKAFAADYPDVQFCQLSNGVPANVKEGGNYHTFNARSYEGHYVGGVVAGMKLREMIDSGVISADEALIGYIGSYPTAEVISGFTAFFLGARSVAPEALMRVRYVNALSNFMLEKNNAKLLIDEGCVIIAQNTGTTGPAAACQDAAAKRDVYHVSYNGSSLDIAPAASLVSVRPNWEPYMIGSIRAVMNEKPIEKFISGVVHGNDICGGFDLGWLEMMSLNQSVTAEGTEEKILEVIDAIKKGQVDVFRGEYVGVNPDNSRIIIDLSKGYTENNSSSKPTFHYILRDVITVEK
ncbi:MAG: BMP family ABC transporter substrate-binding protein [Anaerolineaceae bacterium]|nr:BMP family ABC transporter substrate-binding protein [Anaerolineaceae bacterium]